jgi:hypothetical protein
LAAIALRLDPLRRTAPAERAYFLDGLGLSRATVGSILGISQNAASARVSEGRSGTSIRQPRRRG